MDSVDRSIVGAKRAVSNFTISLQVVSPSVGVPGTLEFHDLPVDTQVKELKTLIRGTLSSQPSEELQRLIYHGRMLTRDTETMLEIFGEEALRSSVFQVIHLVLRPLSEDIKTAKCTETREIYVPAIPIPAQNPKLQPAEETPFTASPELNPDEVPQNHQHISSPQFQQQQTVSYKLEEVQTIMEQKLIKLQIETQRLNQEIHEIGDQAILRTNSAEPCSKEQKIQNPSTGLIPGSSPLSDRQSSHLNSQAPSNLFQGQGDYFPCDNQDLLGEIKSAKGSTASISRRESMNTGPSDQPAHTKETESCRATINETSTAIPNQLLSRRQPNHGQLKESCNSSRSISHSTEGSSSLNQLANHTGSSTLSPDIMKSKFFSSSLSSVATPSLTTSISLNPCSNSSDENFRSESDLPTNTVDKKPLVYILSSPSGPSAILMSSTQNFYTPSPSSMRPRYSISNSLNSVSQLAFSGRDRQTRRQDREPRNPDGRAAELRLADPRANFRVGGIGIQVGQILWLIIRLVGFVWFFTAGSPSWTRWFMASGLAFVVFIVLTGILNGLIERLWSPIRRHLEALVPLGPAHPQNIPLDLNRAQGLAGDDDQALPRQPGARNNNRDERGRADLSPAADVSLRIERQTQPNSGLLMTQIRRLEQALILFVASLVPGVSERHIAHREAQANRDTELQQQLLETAHMNNEISPSTETHDSDNVGKNEQDNTQNPLNEEDVS